MLDLVVGIIYISYVLIETTQTKEITMNEVKLAETIAILKDFQIHGIRQVGKDLSKVLRFQDIVGTSTKDDIIEAWKNLDEQMKRLFIWAVVSTCGYEMSTNVIDYTMGLDSKKRVLAGLKEEFDEIEEASVKLCDEKNAFAAEKRQVETIKAQHNQILTILGKK